MAKLRQKMIRVMELKNFTNHTQKSCLAAVTGITRFYNQSPDSLTKEKIEDYLLYLKLERAMLPTAVALFVAGFDFSTKTLPKKKSP